MRKATMGPVSVSALLISAFLHAGGLAALAWMDWASPGAPQVSGGAGGGGPFEVEIEAAGPDRNDAVAAAPPVEPPPVEPPPVEPPPAAPPPAAPAAPDFDEPVAAQSEPTPPPAAEEAPPEIRPAAAPDDLLATPSPEAPAAGRQPPGAGREHEGLPGSSAPVIHDAGALRPVYPRSCLRARHQGTTVVRAFLGEDGVPERVEVLKSAGCAELDRAAVEAMLHAHFRPARSWGRPVASTVDQPFEFLLKPKR